MKKQSFISRVKTAIELFRKGMTIAGVNSRGSSWTTLIRESYTGAFQQDVQISTDAVLAQTTVFSCITLIASDIGKLGLNLVQEDENDICVPVDSKAFSPVLRKPNQFQTRQQFVESWILSKLTRGNAYILKRRDNRKVVTALYVLNPDLVRPLVATDGSVYYALQEDWLAGLDAGIPAIPASELIHDRFNCLFHPLVGLSPIFACGLAATQALNIQNNSVKFFQNMSQPGGILTAPDEINEETATRLKEYWKENFSGNKAGNLVALGDGLKYEALSVNAVDAQLVEQLKMSAEQICSTYHVPAYMVGAAPTPTYNNIEALNQQYYSQCLQTLIEAAESCLEDGLSLPSNFEIEFEIDDLLRMDKATQAEALQKLAGIQSPNEARKRLNLKPLIGGDTVYLQQQNYSLEALNKRDTGADPFGSIKPPSLPPQDTTAQDTAKLMDHITKGLGMDIKEIGDQLVHTFKIYVGKAVESINLRIDTLEKKLIELPIPKDGVNGLNGKDGTPGANGKDGADGLNGKDGTPGANGKDGADGLNGKDGTPGIHGEKGLNGKDGADGLNGKDGASGNQGEKGLNGKDGAPGANGKDGVDGLNGKDGMPGIHGEKGLDGNDGKDADMDLVYKFITDSIEKTIPDIIAKSVSLIPKPADGRDGRDGTPGKDGSNGERGITGEKGIDGKNGDDGFSPEDFNIESLDGGRTIRASLKHGDRKTVREIQLAIPLDRGVYKFGMIAKAGDGVTYGGSWWIAQKDTDEIPGKSEDWRLAVKRGQHGKDLR